MDSGRELAAEALVDGHLPPKHKFPNAATSIELTEFLRLLIVKVKAKAPALTGREIRHRFYALRRGGAFEAVERAFVGAAHLRKSIVEPRDVPFYRDLVVTESAKGATYSRKWAAFGPSKPDGDDVSRRR